MIPVDNRRCRIMYLCRFSPFRTALDRRKSEEPFGDNAAGCCTGFVACNVGAFRRPLPLDEYHARLPEGGARTRMGSPIIDSWWLRKSGLGPGGQEGGGISIRQPLLPPLPRHS